jgi:hypothetical protein
LNGEIFYSLKEAQTVIESWRIHYNPRRPHSALGYSWHRADFRCYWRWKSKAREGRPRISGELRVLIRRMSIEGWGFASLSEGPKPHASILKVRFPESPRAAMAPKNLFDPCRYA